MLGNVLSAQYGEQPAGSTLVRSVLLHAANGLSPDVPEIAIPPLTPPGSTGVLHIEAGVERHAVWRRVRPVHCRLALLTDPRSVGLAGKQHRMGIGVLSSCDGVRQHTQEESGNQAGVGVPLSEEPDDALVEPKHGVVENPHLPAVRGVGIARVRY